jgi:hypothetical protein
MIQLPRIALGTVTGIALLNIVSHLSGAGSAFPSVAPDEAVRHLNSERRRSDALEDQSQALKACAERKGRVVAALVAGELSLPDAARACRRLHETSGCSLTALRAHFPGAGDEEVLCRHLIAHAELSSRPAERDAVRDRLEKELQEYLEATAVSTRP